MNIDIVLDKKVDNSYKIYIDDLGVTELNTKVAIVTNPKVSGLHLKMLLSKLNAKECFIITVPDGENHKNLATVEYILDRLFEHKFDRKSILIAFGGGVIGDMTGFVASIYQRGIDFIQIPTTLLSQVDASVGGKTGVNNKFGKNLIGAFYQPKAVYIDPFFLSTLPKREFSAGVAEIIKMAVMFDYSFFDFLESNDIKNNKNNLEYAIKKCIELKASVVSQDETEKGIRAVLNYGHTFAHVIEQETNYLGYLHGEAVAMGIVMANKLALKLGFINNMESQRVEELLKKYELPTRYVISSVDSFYDMFFLDKKSSSYKITFILPNSIGRYKICNDIEEKLVKSVLHEFAI